MSIGPWMMYGRNSQLTLPDFTYLSTSAGAPSSSNALQCGQDSEPISTSFTVAWGLPIMKPPAVVALTTSAQVPPGGGLAWVIVTVSLAVAAVLPPAGFLLH